MLFKEKSLSKSCYKDRNIRSVKKFCNLGCGAELGVLIIVKHPTALPQTGALHSTHGTVTDLPNSSQGFLHGLPDSHTEVISR